MNDFPLHIHLIIPWYCYSSSDALVFLYAHRKKCLVSSSFIKTYVVCVLCVFVQRLRRKITEYFEWHGVSFQYINAYQWREINWKYSIHNFVCLPNLVWIMQFSHSTVHIVGKKQSMNQRIRRLRKWVRVSEIKTDYWEFVSLRYFRFKIMIQNKK